MSISSLFSKTVNLGAMLSDIIKDSQNSLGVLELKKSYEDRKAFVDYLYMEMVKFYFFHDSLEEEYNLKETILKNKSFPDVEIAKKKLKNFNEKFSFKNLANLYTDKTADSFGLQEMEKHFYSSLKENWVFDKLLEAHFAVILLAGIGLRKKIDYSHILKVSKTEENKFVVEFLIQYAYKIWKMKGYPVSEKHKIIIYEDAINVRLYDYIAETLI